LIFTLIDCIIISRRNYPTNLYYRNDVIEREARMEALVEVKVSLEKYMRKLRRMADEV